MPNYEDLPVTFGTRTTIGDIYGSGTTNPQMRVIDTIGQKATFGSSSDATTAGINPNTGASLPAGFDNGTGDVIAEYNRYGLYNAALTMKPLDPNAPIDASNPLPYWTTGGTATGATDGIQWDWYLSTGVGGVGNTVRVSGLGMQANDDVFMEQIVPARSIWADSDDYWPEVRVVSSTAANSTAFSAYLLIDFYDDTGVLSSGLTGSREVTITGSALVTATATDLLAPNPSPTSRTWSDFRKGYARIRFGVRTTQAISGAWGVLFAGPRLYRSNERVLVTNKGSQTGFAYAMTTHPTLNSLASYDTYGNQLHMLGPQLVAIPFSVVNLAAGATTAMQLWGDTALALATPRIEMPWSGYVIGISWRLSAAITGGQISSIRAVTQAGVTIKDYGALTSASGQTGNIKGSTVSGGGYGVDSFANGTNIGIDIVTGGGLTPAGSLDMAVILYVAYDWTGT